MFKSLKLFKYNGGEQANLDSDKTKVSEIEFVVNAEYPQTKTFDNVEYGGDFTTDTNFDLILFTTKRQTSETLTSEDIDYREDTYKFAIPRNALKLNEVEQLANKSYKDRMKENISSVIISMIVMVVMNLKYLILVQLIDTQ